MPSTIHSMTRVFDGLSATQRAEWDKNGYLVIPNALSPETVSSLLGEAHKMLDEFSLESHPMTKFTTGSSDTHVGDDYFLTSGDQIRFFFEPAAFDGSGALTKPKERAINKIGHGLHFLSPPFRAISLNAQNAAIARSLGFRDPRVLQSMVICKQPEIGGAVESHQDSTFLYTDPPSAVGFWYALEDTTSENGSLSFARGSQKRCPVTERFVRKEGAGGTEFVAVPEGKRGVDEAAVNGQVEEFVMEEVKAGSLVLIHGNVLHKSEKNLSGKSRFIYTFHVIEGENEYDARNWLQPAKEGFSKLNEVAA